MAGVFDVKNMEERLGKHIPEGETLLAGIHCVNKELQVLRYYQNSAPYDDKVVRIEDAETNVLQVKKSKYSAHDLYIGITQNHFVFTTCEDRKYAYEFDYVTDDVAYELSDINEYVYLRDIGHCFKLSDIETCEFKKGLFGSIKCKLVFKDKSTFQLLLPNRAGAGNPMPNHLQYREQIMDCLKK